MYESYRLFQIFLRLRCRYADQPVPATGRTDAGHRHAVRFGGADGIPHADGELETPMVQGVQKHISRAEQNKHNRVCTEWGKPRNESSGLFSKRITVNSGLPPPLLRRLVRRALLEMELFC